MKRKFKYLGATCIAALALCGLGASSAFAAEVVPVGGASFPLGFTGTSGVGTLNIPGVAQVECTSDTVTGTLTNSTEDDAVVTFHGCALVTPIAGPCNSAGQPSGTIVTNPLHSTLINLGGGKLGTRLTPATGTTFVSFSCLGGLINNVVTGCVIGENTSPGIGVPSNTFTINFAESEGKQEWNEGGECELLTSVNGGEPLPSTEVTEETATLNEGKEVEFIE